MLYTPEQLLHHIQNGKSLGQLVTLSGLSPTELEELADQHGWVFGSNGVARRSAIPVDLGEVAQARADDAASLAGGDELVSRDVLDDQADRELDAALDAIEDADWPHLVALGRQSPYPRTVAEAEQLEADAEVLRAQLVHERDDIAEQERRREVLRAALLEAEQLESTLQAKRAEIEHMVPEAAIRVWAADHGIQTSGRGRVQDDVRRAYYRAQLTDEQVPA